MTVDEMNERKREHGLSYQRISELSGVPLSTVQKVLGKQTSNPRESTLQALRRVLTYDMGGERAPGYVYPTYRMGRNLTTDGELLKLVADVRADNTETSGNDTVSKEIVYGTGALKNTPGQFSIADYLALSRENRVELIHGVIYDMGSPTVTHQLLLAEISSVFRDYIKKNKGKCLPVLSPIDVQILDDDTTMVEPDFIVICDREKIQKGRITGAPDFVLEVLSKSSRRYDSITKLSLYTEANVPEYWIVDPYKRVVIVYEAKEDYSPVIYSFEDSIPVGIYDGKCKVDMAEIMAYIDAIDA